MAIAFDAASSSSAANASSLSFSHTCTGSDRLLVTTVGTNGTPVTHDGVTYNSVALTNKWTATQQFVRSSGWGLVAPSTGSNTIAVTVGATEDTIIAGGVSFTGVDQTTPFGTANTNNGFLTSIPTVTIVSATGEVVIDGVATTETSLTVDGSQTERWKLENVGGSADSSGSSTEAGAVAVVMSWTIGSAVNWAIGGIPIKPSAGTASIVPVLMAEYRHRRN